VPDIRIVTVGDKRRFKAGAHVALRAVGPPGTTDYEWLLDGAVLADATTNQYLLTMGTETAGYYTVRATVRGRAQTSDAIRIAIDDAAGDDGNDDGGGVGSTPRRGEPVPYHARFARLSAVVIVALGALLLGVLAYLASRVLSDTFWPGLEGRLKIAIVLGLPATVVGLVALLFGLWMVAVEWRGRLDAAPAVGMFRGAAIPMVVGAVLLFGTAWVAASAAGTASPGGISSPAAAPARTSAPSPSGAATSSPTPT
jgi:hypothetical protein